MSDWAEGVFSAPTVSSGGGAVLGKLLGAASVANPLGAVLGGGLSSTASSASNGNRMDSKVDHSGWNVNFGGGSITSSATTESVSQWIGIAAGIVTILVALKMLKR